ncbi:MAG TPA: tetratricopeptide repeat protein [Opitutales bacterium]|nr:tetratricopeptide repeat protein [Opitutales bacterium]
MNFSAALFSKYLAVAWLFLSVMGIVWGDKKDLVEIPDIPSANTQGPQQMQQAYAQTIEIDSLKAALKSTSPASKQSVSLFVAQNNQVQKDRITGLYNKARFAAHNGNIQGAEDAYIQILSSHISNSQRRELLIEMADVYRKAQLPVKEIAVYESFVEVYPKDPRTPRIYLELGCLYRDAGSNDMALARFYNVLNLALNYGDSDLEQFQDLSTQAQIEIADTYFRDGQYQQAAKFLDRLKLVKLSEQESAQVYFKEASAFYYQKNYDIAAADFKEFIKKYPASDLFAEAYFCLADCYRKLGKHEEALRTVMDLLQLKVVSDPSQPGTVLMWKKRTGNQLANELYEQGDFFGALSIYQAMAPLSNDPAWQWPVLYQIGLCFERLTMYPKAREAYRLIVESPKAKELLAQSA